MVEAADIVIKALESNWKESEHESFQETSLEKATKTQQQARNRGQHRCSDHKLSVDFKFSDDECFCVSLLKE